MRKTVRMLPLLAPAMLVWAGAAAADPPQVQRATVQARAEHTFALADTDHDGMLSKAEYRAAILAVAKRYDATPTPQGLAAADAQFDAIDTMHSGRIPRAAFVSAALAHFDGADLNHDGTVTPDEARKAARIKQKALKAAAKAG